jgi:hypothetical protein
MPFIPAERTFRCVVDMLVGSKHTINVFHVERDPDFAIVDQDYADGLAQDIWNNWRDHIMPMLTTDTKLVSVDVRDMGNEEGVRSLLAEAVQPAGAKGGDRIVANAAVLVKILTSVPSKAGRGRMFIAGVSETDVDKDSKLTATVLTAWNTAVNNFMDGLIDGSQPPGSPNRGLAVASYYFHNAPRATARVTRATSITVDQLLASQRRRLRS